MSQHAAAQLERSCPKAGGSLAAAVLTPGDEGDATLSVSSESGSLPTQVEAQAPATQAPTVQAPATQLAKKLTEASLEDAAEESPKEQQEEKSEPPVLVKVPPPQPQLTVDSGPRRPSLPTSKEEGPQDLRVFELNSDSGKSTPSNNGKKGMETLECWSGNLEMLKLFTFLDVVESTCWQQTEGSACLGAS